MGYFALNDYNKSIELLDSYKKIYSEMEGMEKEVEALALSISILNSEKTYQEDSEAHSDVTLEIEKGKEIPLAEWARREGLDESYARQKARRGSLKTAHKVGRDWFISELEINTDNRRKK